MPRNESSNTTQAHRFPYYRENPLPTYEEATGIIPRRTNIDEIVVNVPVFSTHRWPVNNPNRVANHYSYNQVTAPHVSSNASPSNEIQEERYRTREKYDCNKVLAIMTIIAMMMFFGGLFSVLFF